METQDGLKLLATKYSNYDWYDSVGLDRYGRYIVYVTTMNLDVMKAVQHSLEKKQVLISYANSKPENVKNYIIQYDPTKKESLHFLDFLDEIVGEWTQANADSSKMVDEVESIDIEELISSLDRLERICGSHGLQDIFYEIHDGKNAVTNLGAKYPEVKRDMQKLYNQYGFDIIYEELDG